MKRKIITAVFLMVGGSAGITALPYLWELAGIRNNLFNNVFVNFGVGALIFYLLSFLLMKLILDIIQKIENYFSTLSVSYMLFGSIGTIIGLVLAWLIGISLTSLRIPVINDVLPAILSLILAYFGFRVGTTRIEEFRKLFAPKPKKQEETQMLDRKADDTFRKYKILDTSVIIDGRIYDIAKTGFLEGVIVIPNFVLRELQYIADSSDSLKRVRGRRGLDILNKL
ncbi:MAG TPA: PIN domain nuclease, partial [Trichococcus flocculiformis]|nr:PIN domain nuclease [Trichococcus flocculiformis]